MKTVKIKRIVIVLLAALLLVFMLPVTASAQTSFQSMLADFSLAICKSVDANGDPVLFTGADTPSRDEEAFLYFRYKIGGTDLAVNEKYEFTISGDLTDFAKTFSILFNNEVAANGEVDEATGVVSLTFTDKAQTEGLLETGTEGYFYFDAKFDSDKISNSGKQELEVTVDSNKFGQTFNFAVDKISATADPVKSGNADLANKQITWTIEVTPKISNATANLTNPADATGMSDSIFNTWTVSDVIEPELTAGGLQYVPGSLELSPDVPSATLNYYDTTRTVSCVFPAGFSIDGTQKYTVSYKVSYTPAEIAARLVGGTAKLTNTANSDFTFPQYEKSAATNPLENGKSVLGSPEDLSVQSNEAEVSIGGGEVNKEGSAAAGNVQKWVLSVTNSLGLPGAQLNDSIPATVDIVEDGGTPAVYIGENASGTRLSEYDAAAPAYPSYGYTTDSDGKHMLTIYLDSNTVTEQKFYYETKVNANYLGGSISNTGEFTWDGTNPPERAIVASKTASVTPGAYYMTKNGSYDAATHTLTWVVMVKPTEMAGLNDVKFIDTIPAGQSYVVGSLQTINAAGTALEDGSSKLNLSDSDTVMTVNFGSGIQWSSDPNLPAFTYKTLVTDNNLWALNSTSDATNSVVIKADTLHSEGYRYTATTPVVSKVIEKTAVDYDHAHKTLQWRLVVNDNEMTLTNPSITDVTDVGWDYLPSTLSVTRGGSSITNYSVSYSTRSDGRKQMVINLPDAAQGTESAKPVTITYSTSMYDESALLNVSSWIVNNSATLQADEMPTGGQTVTSNKTVSTPMLEKQARNAAAAKFDGFLTWEVLINQGLTTISAPSGRSLVLADTLESNLALDMDSVQLRNISIAADGSVSDGSPLVFGTDYTFTYDSSTRMFAVDFMTPFITSAYKLTFNTDFIQLNDGGYSNSIVFEELQGPDQTASSGSSVISFSGGRTAPRHSYGYIYVNCTDPSGAPLAGAVYTLTKPGTTQTITATTNSAGEAVFFVPVGSYTLTEITAPAGYTAAPVQSRTVTADRNTPHSVNFINSLIHAPASGGQGAGRINPKTGL